MSLESGLVVERFAALGTTVRSEQFGPLARMLEGVLQQAGMILAGLSANHTGSFRQFVAMLVLDMLFDGAFVRKGFPAKLALVGFEPGVDFRVGQ